MSKKLMTASYSDNDVYGVGERLAAEINGTLSASMLPPAISRPPFGR